MTDQKDSADRLAQQPAPTRSSVTPEGQRGSTELETDARAAKESADQVVEGAKQKAKELKEQTKRAAADAKQHARSFAEEQKDEAADRVDGFADALRSAAGSLDDQNQTAMAGYAHQAASGLEQVSSAISNRSLDDLVETVEDFARRQPVAFLGGAALAGFVMARFAKSSAERRHVGGHQHDEGRESTYASRGDGHNPAGMAPEDRTSHRLPDAPKQEVK